MFMYVCKPVFLAVSVKKLYSNYIIHPNSKGMKILASVSLFQFNKLVSL